MLEKAKIIWNTELFGLVKVSTIVYVALGAVLVVPMVIRIFKK